MCTIWKLEPAPGGTLHAILIDYLLAIVMVFVTGLLLLASLVISTVLPLVMDLIGDEDPESRVHFRLLEFAISLVFLTLLFAAMYRILSGNRIAWRYIWYGSIIASLLFALGKNLLGLYLLYFSPSSAYGAAGSLVVFLLWVYYCAQILFFCAELIQARRTCNEWLPGAH